MILYQGVLVGAGGYRRALQRGVELSAKVGLLVIADRDVSATAVAAWALWIVGGALVVVGAFFDLWFTGVGLYTAGVGGVLSIRRMFCEDSRRRQNAFELGRDYERAGPVRSLR